MEINALNLKRILSNTTKPSTKSSNNDVFNKVLEKASQPAENRQSNQTNLNEQRNVEKTKSNDVDNSKNKPLSNEEKAALKEAGFNDSEIDNIKSEKDLKEAIVKKLLGGDAKENENINSLLAMLMSLMQGNFDNTNYMNIKSIIDQNSGNAEKLLNILSNLTSQGKSNTDLLGMLKKELSPDMVQALNLNGDNVIEKIKTELSAILGNEEKNANIITNFNNNNEESAIDKGINPLLNNAKVVAKNIKDDSNTNKNDGLEDIKDAIKNTQGGQIEAPVKNDKKSSDTNLMMEDGNSKSDEDFLKNLLSNNSNDKISKVTNFMSQFNNAKVENVNVAEIENLVVNKNNFSADMIKSIKYMELNNMKDLTVKINPKELGEVVIRLTMEAGAMKATITAANKEAFNLLNSNLADMTNKLQNSDIKVQSLALNIYNEDTTFFKDGSKNQQSHEENKGKRNYTVGAISEEETVDNTSSIDSNVNMLA
ncbi:flagellar hook-length control protein FliK [Clostridium aciditolerans]|uniref:Flagellar hook-length control protein FliK n=1 Tax=Clostridium aciditolerans TaxID=339861 RepID=A0A934HWZ5_9CLOT|nr:flagellar hook-length control protein FliK [Clostridium aciditolerans]MBI6875780.1 flagellar hook-length control protein FliK [Clostridium aciditolerans]